MQTLVHTLIRTDTRTQPYPATPMNTSERLMSRQIIRTDEVTTCVLLSTGTFSSTESMTPLNRFKKNTVKS
jgi:hypothetical protein